MSGIPLSKPLMGEEEKKAVADVIDSGMYAQGEKVKEFEQEFADYIGTKYAIATSNGTAGIVAALNALDVSGGEVLVPSFSFIATATPVVYNNAKPVFVDIDERTFNMDPADLERKITGKTKAIMPVHLYGQTAEMDRIMEMAKKHDLRVVEDAAQAHGAEFDGKRAGSFGDCGCFSFYPTKNITTAEGGIVTTNDGVLAEKMRLYRNHGQSERYLHVSLGYNFRMTELQAALGIVQMKKIDEFTKKRRKNAAYYDDNLEKVETPYVHPKAKHVYHQYTIKSDRRDALERHLKSKGVGCKIYYPIPIHRQPVFDLKHVKLPVTEKICEKVLSLPVHPALKQGDLQKVVNTINSFQ
jgi:perosamine synthetase